MEKFHVVAQVRSTTGKGFARRLRRDGGVPGVVYSGGKDATMVSVSPKDLSKALMGPFRRNQLISLEVDGATRSVMVRELQKDPIRRTAVHIDFIEVDEQQPVVVKVPFFATGRSKPVIAGGKIQVPLRTLRVRCLPAHIPERIDLDTTTFDIGVYRAKQVPMPEGVTLVDDGHLTVVTISRGRGGAESEG